MIFHPQGKGTLPMETIVGRVRRQLASRGVHGFVGLQRKLRLYDANRDGLLALSELRMAVRDATLALSDEVQYDRISLNQKNNLK
jgi:hypothetical protein